MNGTQNAWVWHRMQDVRSGGVGTEGTGYAGCAAEA